MSEITISRFELYPAVEPTCYVVGFTIDGRYQESLVNLKLADGLDEPQIVDLAYELVRETVEARTEPKKILNAKYTPKDPKSKEITDLKKLITGNDESHE